MSRLRSRWLAVFGGVTLIALSLSTAFAAKPEDTNRGQQVSAFVHTLLSSVEETGDDTADETADDTETTDDTETPTDESAPSDHGTCVAAVAQDPEAVGPPKDNHGGAVSEAARVTCWQDAATDETNTGEPTEDSSDSEVESDEDAGDTEEADDAGASVSGPDHSKGDGHDQGGDSSED